MPFAVNFSGCDPGLSGFNLRCTTSHQEAMTSTVRGNLDAPEHRACKQMMMPCCRSMTTFLQCCALHDRLTILCAPMKSRCHDEGPAFLPDLVLLWNLQQQLTCHDSNSLLHQSSTTGHVLQPIGLFLVRVLCLRDLRAVKEASLIGFGRCNAINDR